MGRFLSQVGRSLSEAWSASEGLEVVDSQLTGAPVEVLVPGEEADPSRYEAKTEEILSPGVPDR